MKWLNRILYPCLALMVWVAVTQAAGDKEAVPVIEIEGAAHNFDQVKQGEVIKHDFRVFNHGNAPLQIKKVKPG